ncbi:hydantoinase B/oxoprolinase family protein [Glacieibacterium frigidum]|uniref:5-oxoprolinase n=1 Tax=Glacieibacterium frigidum TaxID=2593303 RepID=A0A552UH79_9SPHN|nr:hydantoinase B/oxoprolinase family protein [Glacieibacterium frigidum]TRW17576.1 5-oxoprolinase [Glacieibacterium frigidum]
MTAWEFWVDRGGTFTDIVARTPEGGIVTHKLLSEDPARPGDAATAGIRALLGLTDGEPLPPIAGVRMGTTVATNALLERRGSRTALTITRGFGDALRIGYQARPRLFDLDIRLPKPLYDHVIEIDERVGADGLVVRELDEERAAADFAAARAAGCEAVAIVLMHGWRFTAHEARLAELARAAGFAQVSVSHEVAPLIKLIGRGDTTVVDAYLSPVLRRYVEGVAAGLGDTPLLFMQSNGGLTAASAFRGKDAVLSGPAGGIVGMVRTGTAAGFDRLIGFDMGGTSTDVSHYGGTFERTTETEVAGVRLRVPMLAIHTVAAGGGSICRFDGERLRVGPGSAGAVPGPAAYGRGGPLTVTDCNVLLGRLDPAYFPALFGADGRQPLDVEAVRAGFDALSAETGLTPVALAEGFLTIAVEHMARAIRQISVAKGHDVAGYVLACFGGAGGQHACRVAAALGMTRVMIHPLAGVLSAYGIGAAEVRAVAQASVVAGDDLAAVAARLEAQARADLAAQGVALERVAVVAQAGVRYAGTDATLDVPFGGDLRAAFENQHRARFGFVADGAIEVATLAVEAIGTTHGLGVAVDVPAGPPVRLGEGAAGPVWDRATLPAGWRATGPAVVVDASGTTVVETGWQVEVDALGNLMLCPEVRALTSSSPRRGGPISSSRRAEGDPVPQAVSMGPRLRGDDEGEIDPVRLELFANRFMGTAEEMGLALQTTAYSVNIKERLDFSCALFDKSGQLIANAPHMPVHLGSMGDSIRAVIAGAGRLARGDVWMLNAPFNGGTHLPDITVVMPVFEGEDTPAYFVAARGHHADVGGITPGSMPPGSRSLADEGVLFDTVPLVRCGVFQEADIRTRLVAGGARNPDQSMGDLKAQVAACARGAAEIARAVAEHGRATIDAYMAHVLDNAESAVRRVIDRLSDGDFAYEMDSGAVVRVAVRIDREARAATVDFTGTSPQQPDNFNAPRSVTRAAVLYAFRCLVGDDIPLNDGCLRPVTIVIPDGCMLSPDRTAAVVAGNVETSQVVTDALFGALGACAGSQGTMNNFTFGNTSVQYYETIAGGAGAGPGFAGASAVQTHMTNSRLTDPEVLETRFPVRLESFAVRRGSGGAGEWPGGDGIVRRVRALEPLTAGILSNRRRVPPFGLAGGRTGEKGINRVERGDGSVEVLGATATVELAAGDIFVIETPGGGGYG